MGWDNFPKVKSTCLAIFYKSCPHPVGHSDNSRGLWSTYSGSIKHYRALWSTLELTRELWSTLKHSEAL